MVQRLKSVEEKWRILIMYSVPLALKNPWRRPWGCDWLEEALSRDRGAAISGRRPCGYDWLEEALSRDRGAAISGRRPWGYDWLEEALSRDRGAAISGRAGSSTQSPPTPSAALASNSTRFYISLVPHEFFCLHLLHLLFLETAVRGTAVITLSIVRC